MNQSNPTTNDLDTFVVPGKFFLPMLAAVVALTPFAIDTYLPAMAMIAKDLDTDMGMMQLSVSLFLAGYACGLLFFGAMADIFGRRPIMLLGLIGYGICTALLTVTESIYPFLLLRLIQAFIGAAATVPVSGYVKAIYGKNMAKGMSYVSMIMMLAPLVAPTVGVLLLSLSGWPLIFICLTGYALVMLIFAFTYLPIIPRKPMTDTLFNTVFNAYVVVLSERSIRRNILIICFSSLSFFGYLTAIPFIYMEVYQVSEQMFGILFGLNVVAFMLGNFINTRVVGRFGSSKMVRIAMGFIVSAGVLLVVANVLQLPLFWTVLSLAVFLGATVVLSSNNDALILLAFSENTGTATGVIGVLRFGCGAMAGPIMAFFHNGTAMPFVFLLAFSALSTLACILLGAAKTSPSAD